MDKYRGLVLLGLVITFSSFFVVSYGILPWLVIIIGFGLSIWAESHIPASSSGSMPDGNPFDPKNRF